jgi:two-component system cell cycle sensor histidine kinase/response regulator CckA
VPTRADTTMIEQVILNLVLNARDAMPRGGRLVVGTAVVDIAPAAVPPAVNARAGRFACLTVSDTGTGIQPEIMPRLFEPFFTTKDVGKGTGLALATVFGIVDQHKGWIDVASEVDHGTTFQIYLPADTEVPLVPSLSEDSATRPPPSPSRVILLVEDDSSVRNLARRTLLGHGHRVLEAASGPLALEVWRKHRDEIEILLTDVVMPDGLNGIELAQRLLTEKPALKVIYASGYSADVSGGDFSGREGVDFIGKPYTPASLLRIVERAATGLSSAQPAQPAGT